MSSLLVLNSSAAGGASVSRLLVEAADAGLPAAAPETKVVSRDLDADAIAHITASNLAGVRGTPKTAEQNAARELSGTLIAELKAADTIVIGKQVIVVQSPAAACIRKARPGLSTSRSLICASCSASSA